MAFQDKKFLDAEGITHLVRLLDEYPNNQVLGSVIDAIEGELEQKAEKSEIPEVLVQNVQVNGMSVLSNGVANVPVATNSVYGVMKVDSYNGVQVRSTDGQLIVVRAIDNDIKTSNQPYKPIVPSTQDKSVFYGLAKAAGADMKNITNTTVGTYPDAQKEAIQSMLGITQMLAPENSNLVASKAYSIGDVFAANGHLYKATAAIAQDEAIIPDTNCIETTMAEAGGKIKDVQVNGASIVQDGVANVPKASTSTMGVVSVGNYGISVSGEDNVLVLNAGPSSEIKTGTGIYKPVVVGRQHQSVFYGLSKAAGVDLKDETVTLGTYPEASKTAIKQMLGVQDGLKVVRLI